MVLYLLRGRVCDKKRQVPHIAWCVLVARTGTRQAKNNHRQEQEVAIKKSRRAEEKYSLFQTQILQQRQKTTLIKISHP